ILDGSAFPEIDVVRLISPSDPQGLGALNRTHHERIAGGRAVGNDQGGDGILIRTELLDVGVIGIGSGGANYQEIAVAAALAHPLECGIYICSSAHQDSARRSGTSYVVRIADAKVGILLRSKRWNCKAP